MSDSLIYALLFLVIVLCIFVGNKVNKKQEEQERRKLKEKKAQELENKKTEYLKMDEAKLSGKWFLLKEKEQEDNRNYLTQKLYNEKYNKKIGFSVTSEEQFLETLNKTREEIDIIEEIYKKKYPDEFNKQLESYAEHLEIVKEARNSKEYRETMDRINKAFYPKKEKSVVGQAVAGGIIAGPAGAVVGALNAVDKNNKIRSEKNK